MSGGFFDYEQFYVLHIAEKLERLFFEEEEFPYSEETKKEFEEAIKTLKKAAVYAERIDFLISGDDSEESFQERLKKELLNVSKLIKENKDEQ